MAGLKINCKTEVARQVSTGLLAAAHLVEQMVSAMGALAGLTCCEGYLINIDSFSSAAEAKAGGAEQQAAPDAEQKQPATAPLQPKAVLPRLTGLKRKGAPLHALSRQQQASAVAPVDSLSAGLAEQPATRSG